jgi:hypothetical protein
MTEEARTRQPDEMFCSNCGALVKKDVQFCHQCGTAIGRASGPASSTGSVAAAASAASMSDEQPTQPWYAQTWAAVVALLFFFPLGLFLMWRYQRWEVWIKTVITVAGSLFTLLVIVSAALGADGDEGGEAVRQEASPSPRAEAPAAAPQPTPSPEPTPTTEPSMPEFTTAECQYLTAVAEQSTAVAAALGDIGEIAGRDDILSDEWKLDMAVQFVIIQRTEEEALALDPPASLDDIHSKWLSILDTTVHATELMTEGIDEIDASKIDAAGGLIVDVSLQTQEITPLIEEFGASRSGQCPPS